MKKTEWFPDDVKPVHEGLYETRVEEDIFEFTTWSVWKDGVWHYACSEDIEKCLRKAEEGHASYWQKREWRGLKEKAA